MTPHRFLDLRPAALLLAVLLPICATALPEDAAQEIVVDAASTELFLDQGLVVYKGTAENPARITQGSLVISGSEIRLERADDGSLEKITATGIPARFEQQPAVDQGVVQASGETLVFDNSARLLTLDVSAEFSQTGNVLTGHHIDYNLDTRRASATSRSAEEQTRMVIPPPQNGN